MKQITDNSLVFVSKNDSSANLSGTWKVVITAGSGVTVIGSEIDEKTKAAFLVVIIP